jgi:acetoacetate decarboxylase
MEWPCRAHALAPVADLPVKRVVAARHVIANLTLDIGEVAFDYLAQNTQHAKRASESARHAA